MVIIIVMMIMVFFIYFFISTHGLGSPFSNADFKGDQ